MNYSFPGDPLIKYLSECIAQGFLRVNGPLGSFYKKQKKLANQRNTLEGKALHQLNPKLLVSNPLD